MTTSTLKTMLTSKFERPRHREWRRRNSDDANVDVNTTTTAPSSPIREEQRSWKLVTNQSTAIATWGQHWRCKGSEPSVGATCSKHRNRPQRPNILPDLQAVASGDVIESNGVEKKKKISCPDRIMQMRWVQGIFFLTIDPRWRESRSSTRITLVSQQFAKFKFFRKEIMQMSRFFFGCANVICETFCSFSSVTSYRVGYWSS